MTDFITIPGDFAQWLNGQQNGPNVFASVQTNEGKWVCAPGSMEDFPDQFSDLRDTGWEPEVTQLDFSDFPHLKSNENEE